MMGVSAHSVKFSLVSPTSLWTRWWPVWKWCLMLLDILLHKLSLMIPGFVIREKNTHWWCRYAVYSGSTHLIDWTHNVIEHGSNWLHKPQKRMAGHWSWWVITSSHLSSHPDACLTVEQGQSRPIRPHYIFPLNLYALSQTDSEKL